LRRSRDPQQYHQKVIAPAGHATVPCVIAPVPARNSTHNFTKMAEIRPSSEFLDDPDVPCGSSNPHLSLLVHLTEDGRVADNFRAALTAHRSIAARFKGRDLFTHKQFHSFKFEFEAAPHEIHLPVGHLAAPWENVADLVAAGRIKAYREGDGPSFQDLWEKHSGDASRPSAAVRWAAVLSNDHDLNLVLQGLPADAGRVKGIPVLQKDDAPAIVLFRCLLTGDADRKAADGSLRPIFYATDVGKATAAVAAHPAAPLTGMRRVLQRFLVPEEVDLHEASKLVKNPREGFCFRPLGREAGPTDYLEAGGDAPRSGDRSGKFFDPKPVNRKYSKNRLSGFEWCPKPGDAKNKVVRMLGKNTLERISEGSAEKTWGRHSTVWKAINEFAGQVNKKLVWPLEKTTILEFASWCDKVRHLQADTIKTYIFSASARFRSSRGGLPSA